MESNDQLSFDSLKEKTRKRKEKENYSYIPTRYSLAKFPLLHCSAIRRLVSGFREGSAITNSSRHFPVTRFPGTRQLIREEKKI